MIAEGREIAAIHPNMVVKIPMTVEGLKAVKVLSAKALKQMLLWYFLLHPGIVPGRSDLCISFS